MFWGNIASNLVLGIVAIIYCFNRNSLLFANMAYNDGEIGAAIPFQ
jgi:hypothetical protein